MIKNKFSGIRGGISQYVRLASRINPVFLKTEIVADRLKDFCTANKISYTAVLMKTIAAAKKEIPVVNSVARESVFGKKIVIPESVDISIAIEKTYKEETFVATPVIRSVEKKTLSEISSEIALLTSTPFNRLPHMKAISVFYLLPDFLKYLVLRFISASSFLSRTYFGTIGISSLGRFDVTSIYPIWVTSMVLGAGRINRKAIIEENIIISRDILCIDVCFNPSCIDYNSGGRILNFIKNRIEKGDFSLI